MEFPPSNTLLAHYPLSRMKTDRLGFSALSCIPRLHHALRHLFTRGDEVVQLLVRHLAEPVAPDFQLALAARHGDLGALRDLDCRLDLVRGRVALPGWF